MSCFAFNCKDTNYIQKWIYTAWFLLVQQTGDFVMRRAHSIEYQKCKYPYNGRFGLTR